VGGKETVVRNKNLSGKDPVVNLNFENSKEIGGKDAVVKKKKLCDKDPVVNLNFDFYHTQKMPKKCKLCK